MTEVEEIREEISPEEEEEVDPRVQEELEILNSASNEINNLERELERARNKFRSLMTDSSQKLNGLHKKLGKCVQKARAYYELCKESRKAQIDTHKAALEYQKCNGVYKAAKETVALAEEKIAGEKGENLLDPAWQELLNHATAKFMDSDRDRTKAELNHMTKAAEYGAIQKKIQYYEKDMPRSISKSRPYFELKERLEHNLMAERQNVEDLGQALGIKKSQYKAALNRLESISEEVHARRKKGISLPPRTPGVGAESSNDQSDLPSINLDILSETSSMVSYDEFDEGVSISSDTGFDSDSVSLSSETPDLCVGGRSDSPKPSARVMPMVRQHTSPSILGRPHSPGLPKAMRGLGLHDPLRRIPSDPNTAGLRFKPQHPQHAAMGAAPVATAVPASAFEFEAKTIPTPAAPAPRETEEQRRARKERTKMQTQKAFPILAGLSETHKQLSPRLGRAVLARTAVPAYQSLSPQHSPRLQRALGGSPYTSPSSSPHGSPKVQPRGIASEAQTTVPKVVSERRASASGSITSSGGSRQPVPTASAPKPPTKAAESVAPPTTLPATPLTTGVKLDNLPPLQSVVKPKTQSQTPQVAKVLPQPQTPTDQSHGNQLPRKQLPNDQFPRYQLPQQMVQPMVANSNKSGLFDTGERAIPDKTSETVAMANSSSHDNQEGQSAEQPGQ